MSYDFLIEMAWKSAAISAAALFLAALLRSRSAADRGAVLRLAVLLLLSLPVIAALLPALVIETAAPLAEARAPSEAPVAIDATSLMLAGSELAAAGAAPVPSGSGTAAGGDWNDPGILFLLLYLGGVAMVGGRLLAGLVTLRRWTAEARPVADAGWLAALARAETEGRDIRLMISDEAASPLSWGWRRPVILLDRDALHRPEDADAILAHEIAHIVRHDWLSLMLSRLTVALFWFNPLVWRLDREVAHQAEEAADSHAADKVEPARYAQALLDWARQSGAVVPANAMAGSEPGLSRRVRALLDGRFRRRSGSFWSFAAMAACAAIAAPVAALEFVPEVPDAPAAPPAPQAPAAPPAPAAPAAFAAPAAPAPGEAAAFAPPLPMAPAAAPAPPAPPAPGWAPRVAAPPAPPARLAVYHPAAAPRPPRPPHPPHAPPVDGEAIAAEVAAAVGEAMRSAEVVRAHAVANVRIDEKQIEEQVRRAVAAGLADGARGMLHGADGMDSGAAHMDSEAARLARRDYREREIARAAARGDRVTHQELIAASRELREGAREMRKGAEEMRREARQMRRGR